ncbi:XRN 5'-3' exonuclease N-terminus-domain-containing protein [Lentinula edodes]|uniref:5'-3' exoribonuclease n=1 Tax=Lentinula lateritia TaxID=40482 RepID=A0A9W9DZK9_9AGAR|nr:XRN 5'-3' exonuclease N-terminus-domain-containing protein [Lentinula edodes]
MGVPALFRWLSKKYPKIIYPVQEEEEVQVPDENDEIVVIPPRMADSNPNGVEFDNLYLDMNGIVHPCTHPEGRPAPETEEEMMVEIFKYTERVVNMVRPRKLLFMAIDGVAPRAKMNQQRSRRFRAAQEAKEKDEQRKESVLLWEAMGKELSEEEKNKVAWDTNAITPGTPFMDLLAASLRYWVVSKMNTDDGWKGIQVIISDASVPGEGEHKIMDWIRRQRANPGHDPNTRHVIYGLDADLIMLALATHEPHFRVLREDVFGESNSTACRKCGQEGHYAAQCTAELAQIQKKPPSEKKPFIFLDVAVLREYLEVELDVPQAYFPFDFERSIDDWVLLIFFVGNDFLPHLPSLEIREGAIDTLLRIWKQELPRMGGYVTNHGRLELPRVQIILEGLAKREDDIFRRRREGEERQEANAKRRKLEEENSKNGFTAGPSSSLSLTASTSSLTNNTTVAHPSLPPRPDFAARADSIGLGAKPNAESIQNIPTATQALAGSNHDVVANRRAIRMANMSAAEVLKAELAGLVPVKPTASNVDNVPNVLLPSGPEPSMIISDTTATPSVDITMTVDSEDEVPGFGAQSVTDENAPSVSTDFDIPFSEKNNVGTFENGTVGADDVEADPNLAGTKRKLDEMNIEETDETVVVDDDEPPVDGPHSSLAFKVNPDGTVSQEDTVKLWEPGYRDRYYRQKFDVEPNDKEFRRQITKHYVEGMAWVLCYYYQGTPSWQWYYPYHFAPFAADFEDVDKMDIKFEIGQPFKPYEQLMGVFPASSRKHIPEPFHYLMTDDDSPIIDFYPSTFEIDMNGKRMAWQGVALLPFIDPVRLLEAMKEPYTKLTEDEIRRNTWGNNSIFTSDAHPIHPFYEQLYGKRRPKEPLQIDHNLTKGVSGSVLPNPECLPGSTYLTPLVEQNLPDIKNDRSLSVFYFFPKQLTPHRSVLLPGVTRSPRMLSANDLEHARNGGRGRGRGSGYDRGGRDRGGNDRNDPFHSRPPNYGNGRGNSREPYRGQYRGDNGSYNDRGRGRPSPNNSYSNGYGNGRDVSSASNNSYGGYGGYGGGPARDYGNGPTGSYGSAPTGGYGVGNVRGGYGGTSRGYGGSAGNAGGGGARDYEGYGGYGNAGGAGGGPAAYRNNGGYGNAGGNFPGASRGRGSYGDDNHSRYSASGYTNPSHGNGGYNGATQGGPYNPPSRGRGRGW